MATTLLREEPPPQEVTPVRGRIARVVSAALGVWLAISGWLLEQSLYARFDSYFVGAAIMAFAINGFWFRRARYFDTVLAVWLALSTGWVFHRTGVAKWNAYGIAVLVFLISFMPTRLEPSLEELQWQRERRNRI
jgi:hypothetical protein